MASPAVIWTQALQDAARELGRTSYQYENTIPERAREMVTLRPGSVLTPMQLDCVAMLRSRMHSRTPQEDAFNRAWGEAWDAAQVQPGEVMGSYDPALKPRRGEISE